MRSLINTWCETRFHLLRMVLRSFIKHNTTEQRRIQEVSLGGAILVIFDSQVSSPVHYCKRD